MVALFAASAASAAEGGTQVEEVIVTAQKREQALIDVPQSISVVSGSALEEMQAVNFSDYLKLVPGLQMTQSTPGQSRLVVRGINTGGVASTVSVYVDETPFGSSTALVNGAVLAGDFDTFDMQRIEVLRGPQGTFYGASSLGGVVKFVTNPPTFGETIVRARANTEVVKDGGQSYGASFVVNVPFGDTVALRAAGSYRDIAGFVDSRGVAGSDLEEDINDARTYGARASLLFVPTDNFSLRLTALMQNIEADAPTIVEADPNTLVPFYGTYTLSQFVAPFSDVEYRVYNATADWDLGFADLVSSTSYSTQKQTLRSDLTFNLSALVSAIFGVPNEFYLGQNTDVEKFTQELRLSSANSETFEWLVGAYYNEEEGLLRQAYHAVQPGTLTDIAGLPVLGTVDLPSKYKELAAFANLTVHMGEKFSVDIGGRYSENKQSALQAFDGVLAGGARSFAVGSSEDVFTYSVAPHYEINDNASVYARVAKGFRPGGPNVVPPAAPATVPRTFDADSVLSYEAGFKGQTADGRFSLDLSVFHIDWKDIQLLVAVNGFGVNINGARAKSDGVEFIATARPVEGFTVSLNGAYNTASLKDDAGPLVGGFKGDRLPFTPEFSLGLNADYRWTVNETMEAFAGGSLRHLSEQTAGYDAAFRAANGRQRQIKAYDVVDIRGGLDFGRISVEAYIKNLTDSDGVVSTGAVTANGLNLYPNGAIATGVLRPRTVGIAVTADF